LFSDGCLSVFFFFFFFIKNQDFNQNLKKICCCASCAWSSLPFPSWVFFFFCFFWYCLFFQNFRKKKCFQFHTHCTRTARTVFFSPLPVRIFELLSFCPYFPFILFPFDLIIQLFFLCLQVRVLVPVWDSQNGMWVGWRGCVACAGVAWLSQGLLASKLASLTNGVAG